MKKVKILNIQFDVVTLQQAVTRVFDLFKTHRKCAYVVTPNPEMLLETQHNEQFRHILNNAYLSIPDGIGILWASKYQQIAAKHKPGILYIIKTAWSFASLLLYPAYVRTILQERVTGVDLMTAICNQSQTEEKRIFLLGAAPGVAEKVKEIFEKKYPHITICGTFSGSPHDADFSGIQEIINQAQPDILFVAFGAPSQELWIAKHLKELPSITVAIGVGGAFDFIAGVKRRAPLWMQRLGVEWLYRLIQEPSRMKRIYNATIKFPWSVIKQ